MYIISPSPPALPISPLLSLKFVNSSLIVTFYKTHTHTHLLSPFTNVLMCMYFRLTIWDWITCQGPCSWRRLISPTQQPLIVFLSRDGLVRFPLLILELQVVLSLCRSCLWDHIVEISWVQLPVISVSQCLTASERVTFETWPSPTVDSGHWIQFARLL